MSESGGIRIHQISSPCCDVDFYVKCPDEFPSEKTVKCVDCESDISLEYMEADDVAFEVRVGVSEEDD